MNATDFEKIFERLVSMSREVLVEKAKQYANDDDRLHNFNKTAAFEGCTPEMIAWKFNLKHLASISDMVAKDEFFPPEVWDEKIGDAINYLILLRAIVFETDDHLAASSADYSTTEVRARHGLPPVQLTQNIVNQHTPDAPVQPVED